jgi:cobalt-zinc-cadmium efflux system protein
MHDHSNCDHHKPARYDHAFAIGIGLNITFVVGEAFYGFMHSSLSLLADAGHNLGDVLGLAMGWAAALLALRPATERRTYGYRRYTILAAVGNSALLLIGVGAIALEAIERLGKPVAVPANIIMVIAGIGIVVNGGTALAFVRGRKNDINIEGAYMHMLSDAIVASSVVVGAFIMRQTGLTWIDPVMGLIIAAIVALGSWRLLKRSVDMAIDAVPDKVDPVAIRTYLSSQDQVEAVTDLHIWPISTTETALTAHLVAKGEACDELIESITRELRDQFHIDHSTIQVDRTVQPCALSV